MQQQQTGSKRSAEHAELLSVDSERVKRAARAPLLGHADELVDELWLRVMLELFALVMCDNDAIVAVEPGACVPQLVALALTSKRMLRLCGQLLGSLSALFATEHFVQQKSAEWLELRRRKITAAKTGEACGLAPRAIPAHFYRVWTEQLHVGESTVIEDMTACDYGNMHEDRVLALFCRVTGLRVRQAGIFVDRAQPYLGMSPDGLVEPCELLVELADGSRARVLLGESMLEIKTNMHGLVDKPKCEHATQIAQQMHIRRRTWCFHAYWHQDAMIVYLWRFSPEFWAWMDVRLRLHAFYFFNMQLTDVPLVDDEDLGLPADKLLVHAIAHETKEVWFPYKAKSKFTKPFAIAPHIRALLPPKPSVWLVYEQRERIGPLANDKRIPFEDRSCWPGPHISDELLTQWPLITEQALDESKPLEMRILAIRPYLRQPSNARS